MIRVVMYLAELGLLVYALIDCVQTERAQVRNLPKLVWIALIVLLPIVGSISWLLAGRPLREGGAPPSQRPWSTGGPAPRPGGGAPRGPDDDPDFLRHLNPPPPRDSGDDPAGDDPRR
ncbi:PLD nuclease N-terminal domain-containing protein [Angustibacter sp. McL0619]|uniref:PLD nuclease N-terminal domain-containing protein n=1 Tax=Angustibacter sp. McL0619 TaxID=3415676 RepID=UPI003CEF73C1